MQALEEIPFAPPSEDRLVLVEYTDPISIWCWGCEPILRKIEFLYGDAVSIEYRMGGLFEDFRPMREYWTRMSGGRWKESVLTFFAAVAGQHRMPMNPEAMIEALDDFVSTWPGCIATKASWAQGEAAGRRYLRWLREATCVEGRAIHRRAVQLECAAEAGLDVAAMEASLADGSAERAFREDLEECRSLGITGFPTFVLRRGMVNLRIEGYREAGTFLEAIRKLDPDVAPRRVDPTASAVFAFVGRYGRVAAREVSEVFDLPDDDAEILLEDLEARGAVARREWGPAVLWEPAGKV